MAEWKLPKLHTWVRFPSPAPLKGRSGRPVSRGQPRGEGGSMEEKIREKGDGMRKMLQADGGDCEIVEIAGKTVMMRLRGACGSCPHAMATLKGYIEETLKNEVDEGIVVERV